MTIKRKLFSIIFGELLIFLIAVSVAILSLLPILKINSEFGNLNGLAEQVLLMEVKVNSLLYLPMETVYDELTIQNKVLSRQFELVSKTGQLNRISKKVDVSILAVLSLKQLYELRWQNLSEIVPDALDDAENFLYLRNSPLINFYKADGISELENHFEIMERVEELERVISITDGALKSAYDVISAQHAVITEGISGKINDLIIRTVIFFIAALVLIIIVSGKIVNGMAGRILALEEGVSSLRQGRLWTVFNTSSTDEIGKLGDNLNNFTYRLSESIQRITASSCSNQIMKTELSDAADGSKTSSEAISAALSSIRKGMTELGSRVAGSGAAVNTVNTRMEELKRMLDEQTAMIEESTSSVTEMIASINNVSDITGKKKTATDQLVKTAGTGGQRLDETVKIITDITGNVDEIRGTVSTIQSVAAHTSLLAMNAAIEAAHAGEYGAGFSVVAEEIRKLAETSGSSSARISGVLKEVIASIQKAALSGTETRRAFADINTDVKDVASALDEINSSMDELSAGSRRILDAMMNLQGYAADVQEGGGAMTDAAESLENAFRLVEKVTDGVLSQIEGIGSRVDDIRSSVNIVSGISSRLSEESEKLESETAQYQLGCTETENS